MNVRRLAPLALSAESRPSDADRRGQRGTLSRSEIRRRLPAVQVAGAAVPIIEWAKRQRNVVAEFSPDGKYLSAS
jgi:hypothetical protein